jgi:hypothetical protein
MFAPNIFLLADIGLPMIAVYLPLAWLALVPIILIEAWYGTWKYKLPFQRAVSAQTTANCLSTLIGIPITWLALVLIQMPVFELGSHVVPERVVSALSPIWGATWLGPEPSNWLIVIAIAVLTIVFYLMSVAIEGIAVRRFFRDTERKTIRNWMLQANAISYTFLLALFGGAQLLPKASGPLFEAMRPISDGIINMAFWTANEIANPEKKEAPLIKAVQAKDVKKAQQLIAKGADPNQTNDVGFPALSIAASWGNEEMVKLLLKAGAKVNAKSATLTDTALAGAAQRGNAATVRALLAAGANVDDRDGSGWTPLFDAVLSGDLEIIDTVVAAGADVNARSDTGWTALKEAQANKNKEIGERLIRAGAVDYPDGTRQ